MASTGRPGLRKAARAIWEADGRWPAVRDFRQDRVIELMRKKDCSRSDAGRLALDEALEKFPLGDASVGATAPETLSAQPEAQAPAPEALPAALEGDSKAVIAPDDPGTAPEKAAPVQEPTKSEIVDWIFYHIGDHNLTENTALCPAAWYWMTQARVNPIMRGELFAKAMPSRQQIEAIERRKDAKEPTCDLICRFFEHVPVLQPRPEGGGGKPSVQTVGTTGDLG